MSKEKYHTIFLHEEYAPWNTFLCKNWQFAFNSDKFLTLTILGGLPLSGPLPKRFETNKILSL